MVRNLSVTHSHVYVISGSIFDENADGHRDDDGNITRLELSLYVVDCPRKGQFCIIANWPTRPELIPVSLT